MATPVRGMSSRALQAEQTRQQILQTAQHLFAEHGYDATSLLDEAAAIRGRRARTEHIVNGFTDFLIQNRRYAAALASSDPAGKRNKLDDESTTMQATMQRRALSLLFGDNPTGAERLAFNTVFFIPECLPNLADLTDDELHQALRTTMLRVLRI
jgi:AcrR family transcriptional regulator